MGDLVPLTGEIGTHLSELTATAVSGTTLVSSVAPDAALRAAVIDFVLDVEDRRRRGWFKVNMKKVATLRALVGLSDPEREGPD